MKINKEELKNYKYNQKKRENQKRFNILNLDKIKELDFKEIKNRYSNYDKELEKSILKYNLENDLYLLELENYKILLRDRIEKSFFFNKYFMIEYKEEKENFKNFIEFHKSKKFYMIENEKYIILDYENDIIKK